MDTYSAIASWVGWPAVVAILVLLGTFGFVLLNNRIEGLKDRCETLQEQLDLANSYSPDVLLERLASRHKLLSEELERLDKEKNSHKTRIIELESERKEVAHELGKVVSSLFQVIDSMYGQRCVFCSHMTKLQSINVPVQLAGREFTIDLCTVCFACGSRETTVVNVLGDVD